MYCCAIAPINNERCDSRYHKGKIMLKAIINSALFIFEIKKLNERYLKKAPIKNIMRITPFNLKLA